MSTVTDCGEPEKTDSNASTNIEQEGEGEPEIEPHFEPIVNLPEVEVSTNEENENEMFKSRAKLFRFDTSEPGTPQWKERGTGEVKLLRHTENNTVRVVMRRDKTYKICANHFITPWMSLKPCLGSDRAWVWTTAADFADQTIKPECLAIRFATAEIANSWKQKFEEAQKIISEECDLYRNSRTPDSTGESDTSSSEPNSPEKTKKSQIDNEKAEEPEDKNEESKETIEVSEKLAELNVSNHRSKMAEHPRPADPLKAKTKPKRRAYYRKPEHKQNSQVIQDPRPADPPKAKAKPKRPIYYGKPENKRNPRAIQGERPAAPPIVNVKSKKTVHSKLPPLAAQNKPDRSTSIERSSFLDSVFGKGIAVKETNLRTLQQPSLAAITEISRATFNQMMIDNPSSCKVWTPEIFDYYCTAMAWLRIVNLKAKTSQALTLEEELLLSTSSRCNFNLPEPIRLYLSGLGSIRTMAGLHLYAAFPPLPNTVIDNIPGTYGIIDDKTHNLYEEIPCLGVCVGMLKAILSPQRPLPQWVPPMVPEGFVANDNLLNFRRIQLPQREATFILQDVGVTDEIFPNYPTNTGFNFTLLEIISALLANISTFKTSNVNFSTMSEAGCNSQAIIERPAGPFVRCVNADTRLESLNREPVETFSKGLVFSYQLFKEPIVSNTCWCCLTPTAPNIIPDTFVTNRNERRNIPSQYLLPSVVSTCITTAGDHRENVIEKMVITKR